MRKLQKFSRSRSHSRHSRQNSSFSIHRGSVEIGRDAPPIPDPTTPAPDDRSSPRSTFAPASSGAMNTKNGIVETTNSPFSSQTKSNAQHPRYNPSKSGAAPPSVNGNVSSPARMPSTIRTVPSFDAVSDSSCDSPSARNSAFSRSVNSDTSNTSCTSQPNGDTTITVRLKAAGPAPTATPQRPALGPPNNERNASASPVPNGESYSSPPPENDDTAAQGWDSTIGKAGLGKTGRVINKLVSDNEALKRDLKIERLRAEEAKQAAKLLEDKMERMASEFEARLLEAQVTKTLLARKERQVETLSSQVDQEKKRAVQALDREKTWKDEMERMQGDAKRQVEEAENKCLMFEGRYNAISSHWKDQGEEVKRATGRLYHKIDALVEERKKDDEKITVLRELCDQQDGNIRELTGQKDAILEQFEAYKEEQERQLKDIKIKAKEREEEQQRMLDETRDVLHKLKWALNLNQLAAK